MKRLRIIETIRVGSILAETVVIKWQLVKKAGMPVVSRILVKDLVENKVFRYYFSLDTSLLAEAAINACLECKSFTEIYVMMAKRRNTITFSEYILYDALAATIVEHRKLKESKK